MFDNKSKKKTIGHYIRVLKKEDRPIRYLMCKLLWKTGICRMFIIDKGDLNSDFILQVFLCITGTIRTFAKMTRTF